MQIFFRSSKRKCGIKGSSSDELFDMKLSMVQDTNFLGYSMLPSFRTGPVLVQKQLYFIIFVGHLNLRQPKNSKNKRNISAINCRFCRAF